jgi:hypothetical protein
MLLANSVPKPPKSETSKSASRMPISPDCAGRTSGSVSATVMVSVVTVEAPKKVNHPVGRPPSKSASGVAALATEVVRARASVLAVSNRID